MAFRRRDVASAEDGDERIVSGLLGGEPWAAAALFDRHGKHVRRVLTRVLGATDRDAEELVQEVFARAWEGIERLSGPAALGAWLTNIAVFTAREEIRRRRRRRWLSFFAEVPEVEAAWADADIREAARSVYRILDRLPADERIPFALRALEGMELTELAAACETSVATVRRRLARAEARFFKLARNYECLLPWLEEEQR